MSDEAEGNLLKISIAKQIFIHHASKLNYSINRKLLQNFFCKYIHVLNQHAIHLKLTLYYTSRKLEEKVLRDFKKRGALTPPFGLWHLMSDLPWSRDYDTCSFLEGCSSLAQCALLLTVLPWLSTAHPDPLCDPTSPVLCSSISLPSSMTRNLGFGFPHCSMNFLYLWMCPRFSSGRRKGQRFYTCVCSLHTLGTQILSSERRLKVPSTAMYVTVPPPAHSRNCLGVIMGEKRKKGKQKPKVSFSIALALFWSTGKKGRSLPDALSVHVWRVFQRFRLTFILGWLILEGKMINSPLVQEEFKVWSPSWIRLLPSMVRVLRNPLLPFYPSLIVAFSERDRMECFTPTCL